MQHEHELTSEQIEEIARAVRTYGTRIWGAPHLYAVIKGEWDKPVVQGLTSEMAAAEAARMNALAAYEVIAPMVAAAERAPADVDTDYGELIARLLAHKPYNAFTDGPLVQESATAIKALTRRLNSCIDNAAEALNELATARSAIASLQRQLEEATVVSNTMREVTQRQLAELETALASKTEEAERLREENARVRDAHERTAEKLHFYMKEASDLQIRSNLADARANALDSDLIASRRYVQAYGADLAKARDVQAHLEAIIEHVETYHPNAVDAARAALEAGKPTEGRG